MHGNSSTLKGCPPGSRHEKPQQMLTKQAAAHVTKSRTRSDSSSASASVSFLPARRGETGVVQAPQSAGWACQQRRAGTPAGLPDLALPPSTQPDVTHVPRIHPPSQAPTRAALGQPERVVRLPIFAGAHHRILRAHIQAVERPTDHAQQACRGVQRKAMCGTAAQHGCSALCKACAWTSVRLLLGRGARTRRHQLPPVTWVVAHLHIQHCEALAALVVCEAGRAARAQQTQAMAMRARASPGSSSEHQRQLGCCGLRHCIPMCHSCLPYLRSRTRASNTRRQCPPRPKLQRAGAAAAAGGGSTPGAAVLLPAGCQLPASCCRVRSRAAGGLGGPARQLADPTSRGKGACRPRMQVYALKMGCGTSECSSRAAREHSQRGRVCKVAVPRLQRPQLPTSTLW